MASFFSKVESHWSAHSSLRDKYSRLIPIPNPSYFRPIHELSEFTDLLVRPLHNPIWLGVNALLLFLKAFLYLAATLLLLVPALLLAVFAPGSVASSSTCSSFKSCAAHTVVDATMGIIATCAAVAAIVFNPIYLLTRCLSSVVEHLNNVTEECCGLSIARF
ncbi:Uncharacterised protein [Legionella steigerwaltii]|uniref:Uncharacterized protein n=1 Tax=Legionella steigerwaltii TaxID=460 RepID=A0A378L6D7_9GAMM|nr:hypothetical protein [Legionella steigerwaltii]KTD77397.1 hypothetical protein Lstg_1754 [Legionella steigerwaltii]STY22277.1 Uncharacterised protein [Legionella steigerwaltii]